LVPTPDAKKNMNRQNAKVTKDMNLRFL